MELTFVIPKELWFTSNSRLHWAVKARKTKQLRMMAFMQGRSLMNEQGLHRPVFDTCGIEAVVAYPRNGRADPQNTSPMAKALIDGLTDAGYWPDDDSTHVLKVAYTRSPMRSAKGCHIITLNIINLPIYKESQ